MIFIKQNKNHYVLLGLILLLSLFIISWVFYKNNTSNAADARKFNPSNIISDYVMTNKNSMSESAINDFLKNKGNCRDYNLSKVGGSISGEYITRGKLKWHIDGGHFVCLAEERFNGESAAKIIWQAAQDFNINPQVLIVLLEKEQGLILKSWADRGIKPSVVNDQIGRLTFADDLAKGIKHLLDYGAPYGTYNLTNDGEPASWCDVAKLVFDMSEASADDVTPVSTSDYYQDKEGIAARPKNSTLDLTKIKSTGFYPPEWKYKLREYLRDPQK